MDLIIYQNGQYISEKSGSISIFDLGFARGFSLFEYLKTYGGKPFYLSLHLQRLKEGMKKFSMDYPVDEKEIQSIIFTLLQKNRLKEASIKIFITGGISMDLTPGTPTFVITTYPLTELPRSFYEKGISIITKKYLRPFHDVKTTQYAHAIMAMQEAKQKRAQEILYIHEDERVLELSTSHFFGVKNGSIITPRRDILYGVTKDIVLSLCKEVIPFQERDIELSELYDFDEAFLTASNKEVLPITKINDEKIGDGKVGTITKKIMHLFARHTEEYAKETYLCV